MRLTAAPLAASVVLLLILNVPGAIAQDGSDLMKVESKLSITGLASLHGSGSAKVTLTGDPAISVRHLIINKYDSSLNQRLNPDEIRPFMDDISEALIGRPYWGMTIESATNFSAKSDAFILDHTSGLDNEDLDSTEPLSFSVSFEGSGSGAEKDIMLAQGAYDLFADAIWTATGYTYGGEFRVETSVSTFGVCSLTSPHLTGGKLSAVRFPWGEMLWYKFTGVAGGGIIEERITYQTFSVMESQLLGFIVLFIGAIIILRTPSKRFDKYEKLHPRKFRKYAKPLIEVRLSAYILAAVAVVLYVLPYLFSFASRDGLFYSGYLFAFVPAAVVVEWLFSKFIYDRAALEIPEESIIEVKQAIVQPAEGEGEMLCKICYRPIEAGLDMFQCSCGLTMHADCAAKAQNCPSCGQPLVQLRTRSIQCRACGETFLYSGDEDAYSIQCTKCGAFQEEIKPGKNYLIVDSDPRNAFMMIRAMGLSNRPAMCLTTSFPGKIRSDYDLKDVAIKWFSDSMTDIDNVNPKDLEVDAMETVSTFLMTTKGAGVLVDGIDSLIELNGFERVMSFLKKVNDLASTHGSTILLSLDKTKVPPDQFKALSDAFDEIHDFQ